MSATRRGLRASRVSTVLAREPEEFATRIRDDLRAWAAVARAAGMKAE